MTVNITKPALNLRAELKSPPRVRRWLEQQFWFESLARNGGFDSDTLWTKGTGWTISGGVAAFNAASGAVIGQDMAGLFAGRSFRTQFDVTARTAGGAYVQFGGSGSNVGTTRQAVGTYIETLTLTGDRTKLEVGGTGGAALSIDNLSVYPADAAGNVLHALPHGWKPLHVHEDGRLKREGALEDYTVSFDGFRYAVKPAIAPGVATETCIIAIREGADQ